MKVKILAYICLNNHFVWLIEGVGIDGFVQSGL